MAKHKRKFGLIIRNFVFGVEDSLVSTVGLLSGIASVGVERRTIFLTGTILVFVEAFSMATGSFLSEESIEEYERSKANDRPVIASFIMFLSYFLSGFLALFPYLFFETKQAFVISIACSLLALFVLGLISAVFGKKNYLKKGVEMIILGGIAILAGVLVGNLINTL